MTRISAALRHAKDEPHGDCIAFKEMRIYIPPYSFIMKKTLFYFSIPELNLWTDTVYSLDSQSGR